MAPTLLPLLAAEDAGFNPLAFDPSAMWLTLITFGVLLIILGAVAWKPMLKAIEAREKRIDDAIAKADSDRKEAERILADYQSRVSNVQAELAALREKGRQEAEALRTEMRSRAESEAAATIEKARKEIELARSQAVADLRREAVTLGLAVAGKVVGRSLDDADRRRLAQDVVDDLSRVPVGKA